MPVNSGILGQVFDGVGTNGTAIASEEGNIGTLTSLQETTFTFQALSNSTTFVFADSSTQTNGTDVFLDHLVINLVGVPEPSSIGLIAALGIVGGLRRRR